MKKIIILSGIVFSNLIFSQVGINTPNPQGSFHVDGAKDNISTGVPTVGQQSNDFIILSNGNIGVGTVSPANKLDIRSSTNGALKIVDGTQGNAKVLTSDANGVATWKDLPVSANTNIYNSNGTLSGARTVAQGTNALAFTSTATTGTNHFSVDGSTFSVDAVNDRVGIGTAAPSSKLDIRGSVRIADGTQAVGAIFTSDANGVGSWKTTAATKSTVLGVFPTAGTNVLSGGGATPKYSNLSITLPQGRWIINAGMTIYNKSEIIEKSRMWLHVYLSSSNTDIQRNGFTLLGPSGSNTSYAGVLTKGNGSGDSSPSYNDNELNFLSGSSMVDVTATSVTLYLLIEDRPLKTWEFNPRAWENYFYAIPIN
ncbi:hypothetical protein [Chryseobacterium bernardetii]|uniref:hypothetical protein n=1 Tax=Chryseobacterium bernardetii TaxID=1241978 RepID=UPI003016F86A